MATHALPEGADGVGEEPAGAGVGDSTGPAAPEPSTTSPPEPEQPWPEMPQSAA